MARAGETLPRIQRTNKDDGSEYKAIEDLSHNQIMVERRGFEPPTSRVRF